MHLRHTEYTGKKRTELVCDYCLRPQTQIHNTRKIGLSKTFGSDICESCLIFRLREKRDALMNKSGDV